MSKKLVSASNQRIESFISSIEHFFVDKDPKDNNKSTHSKDDNKMLILKFKIHSNENRHFSEEDKYSLII